MKKKITILLSSFNGEKYIKEQIDSLLRQTYKNISILVRDDGSTDNTLNILREYEKKGLLKWYNGKNLKPANSFMDLICKAPKSDFYAFCDQDDVWLDDKIEIAIDKLKKLDSNLPLLYYGTPRIVDKNLVEIKRLSCINDSMTSFREMLIETNATGCTMVFNKTLLELLKSKKPKFILMHDDWIYRVCLATNGLVVHDDDVHILYRQHNDNVVGTSSTIYGKLKKKIKDLKKMKNIRYNVIKTLYECYNELMNDENLKLCSLILNYQKKISIKFKIIFNSKIKSKYFYRNLYFRFLILFNLY